MASGTAYTHHSSRTFPSPKSLVSWSEIEQDVKHKSYMLVTAVKHKIYVNYLDFDLGYMQYVLKSEECQMPSAGLKRTYSASLIEAG